MRDFLETWTREIIIAGLALCSLGWYLYPIFTDLDKNISYGQPRFTEGGFHDLGELLEVL